MMSFLREFLVCGCVAVVAGELLPDPDDRLLHVLSMNLLICANDVEHCCIKHVNRS